MSPSQGHSGFAVTFDLSEPGYQSGDAILRWSDNANPLGYYPVPIISINGGEGPTLLVLGGVHGDEFEGPSAIMRLAQSLRPDLVAGQVILMPAANAPAVLASSRVSPLDGQNLNRAFPGSSQGGPTAMIADFIETQILPICDAVVDLHSGGKASFFQPCALATKAADASLFAKNMQLAQVFGLPLIWQLGQLNDKRSLNSAAERVGIPMIAAELGGGGGVDPVIADQTEQGLYNIMRFLGMISGPKPNPNRARLVELAFSTDTLYAPADGLFDRAIAAGQDIKIGDIAGTFHFPMEPARASLPLAFSASGMVLAHTCRGMVKRGDLLALVVRDVDPQT